MAAEGERVIAATRRPDGTLRKERKVRSGYVPQEEQQVYVSRGAQFRDAAKNHVPGMDAAALAAARAANTAAKSKSARKNEKRKEKKVAEKPAGGSSAGASGSMASVGDRMQQLSIGGGSGGREADGSGAAAAPPAATGAPASYPAAAEKQIRALKKKLRQCEILQREQDEGTELTEQEQLKLDKVEEWEKELAALEQ